MDAVRILGLCVFMLNELVMSCNLVSSNIHLCIYSCIPVNIIIGVARTLAFNGQRTHI